MKNTYFLPFSVTSCLMFLAFCAMHQPAFAFESVQDKKVLGIGSIYDLEVFNQHQACFIASAGVYLLDTDTGQFINRLHNGYLIANTYLLSPNGKWLLSYRPNDNLHQNFLMDAWNGDVYEDLTAYQLPEHPFSKSGDSLLLKKDTNLYEYHIAERKIDLIGPDFFQDYFSSSFSPFNIRFIDTENKMIAGIELISPGAGSSKVEFFHWNRETKQKDLSVILDLVISNSAGEWLGDYCYDPQKDIISIVSGYLSGLFASSTLRTYRIMESNQPCGSENGGAQTGTLFDFSEDNSTFTIGSPGQVILTNAELVCSGEKKYLWGPIETHSNSDYSNDSLYWYYIVWKDNDQNHIQDNLSVNKFTISNSQNEFLFDLREESHDYASISFDNQNLAIKDEFQSVHLWDLEQRRSLQILEGPPSAGNVAFSPKSHQLIWGASGTVFVWDKSENNEFVKQKEIFSVDNANNTYVGYSQDGSLFFIACGTDDQNAQNDVLEVWDSQTLQQKFTIANVADGLQKATFSPNGEQITAVFADGSISIWDVNSGETLHQGKHSNRIDYVEYTNNDQLLLVDSERNLLVYKPEEQLFEKKMENLSIPIIYIKKANLLLAGNQLIDVTRFQITQTLDSTQQDLASITLSPDESVMVICRPSREITTFTTDLILVNNSGVNRYRIHEE